MGENRRIQLPLPVKGLNTVAPFNIDINSGYARELTNYYFENGKLYIRPKSDSYVTSTAYSNRSVHWFSVSGSNIFAILENGDIRNIFAGTGATSIGGTPAYNATRVKHVSLDLVIGCREPRLADNPFTAWTYTTLSLVAASISAACSYKSRLYVAVGTDVEYSEVAAITGTMAGAFPFASLLDGQSILRMFSVTVSPNLTTENVFVVFGSAGKVLVYQGDYPNSTSWQIIGSYDMPTPISNVGFVEVDGDIFVATNKYGYWFRDLFTGGAQTAYDNSPTRPIENLWAACTWSSNVLLPEVAHAFYDQITDSVIIQCSEQATLSNVANYENEGAYFVYSRKYKAWYLWLMTPMFTPVRYNEQTSAQPIGTAYFTELKFLAKSQPVDAWFNTSAVLLIDIETSWKTPYIQNEAGHKANQERMFFENTSSGYLEKIRVIFDNSDYNAPFGFYTQSMVTQINPNNFGDSTLDISTNSSNQYTGLAGATGIGGSISIQHTLKKKLGSSSDQRQSIYGSILLVEDGNELF